MNKTTCSLHDKFNGSWLEKKTANKLCNNTRINIGHQHDRWLELKERSYRQS
jgi:hypothetical protein